MSHYSGSVPTTQRATDWRDHASCRNEDPNLFFPIGNSPTAQKQTRHAKTICWNCPSRTPCAQWALKTRQAFGIWGGMSEAERRAILRRHGVRFNIPDPDDIPPATPATPTGNPLHDTYNRYATATGDGHVVWAGSLRPQVAGKPREARRIAFEVQHGRPPEGRVEQTCGRHRCVAREHLTDRAIRDARNTVPA